MPRKGFKVSEETKLKISKTLKSLGVIPPSTLGKHYKLSEETKRKMSCIVKFK